MAPVGTETRGAVALVTIERPEVRNAVDGPTAGALADAFRWFQAQDDLLAAVLYGAGGSFCSGADLKAFASEPERANRVAPDGDGPMGPTRMTLDKPVIAAVEGYAVGGGFELALWCDLRVVAEGATFGFFDRRWGVPLIDGGTVRLPRLIGQSRALDLVLTGRPVPATEAFEIGLANRLVPRGDALRAAIALAEELTRWPQACLRADRASLFEQWGSDLEAAMRSEFARGVAAAVAGETRAGAQRFAAGLGRHGDFDQI